MTTTTITPFLWFDTPVTAAVEYYKSIFPDTSVEMASDFMAIFTLQGQRFYALNGGPHFKFSEAVSFVIDCADQAEVDRYWDALIADGGQPSQCGWLKDRFGFSWQVVPRELMSLVGDPDPEKAKRATEAMLKMGKLDLEALRRAHAGV